MIAVVILAAGSASRMKGRDKLMEDVDGMPLLRRTVLRALATNCAVFVTLPPPVHARHGALVDLPVTQVPVLDASEGINASLRAGLAALPQGVDAAMVMLADMPDLTTDDLNTVLQAVDLSSGTMIWRATTEDGAAGHPIIFHADRLPELMQLRGDEGGHTVVKAHAAQTELIPLPDNHARTDLDTPEAWAAWREKQQTS